MKLGIALSGGGARGIAHIGVLKALEENGIFPEVISGASAGAIVGALYAAGKSTDEILDFVKDASALKFFRVSIPRRGLTSLTYLRERLEDVLPEDDFAVLQKKMYVAVTNLLSGKLEIIEEGALHEVITASSAIPLVFQPVEMRDSLYIDGGNLANLPVNPLIKNTDAIIGVNVMPHVPVEMKAVNSMVGIAVRCFEMAIWANTRPSLKQCDVVIEPTKVHQFNLFQFNKYKEMYEFGYEAASMKIPEIKARLEAKLVASNNP